MNSEGSSVDRIARLFGARSSRRRALAQLGTGAAAVAGVAGASRAVANVSAQSSSEACVISFRSTVTSSTYCGDYFDGTLSFTNGPGVTASGELTITDSSIPDLPSIELNKAYQFTGTGVGSSLFISAAVEDGRLLSFLGAGQGAIASCDTDIAGTFAGPIACITGSWTTLIEDTSELCTCCCDGTPGEAAGTIPAPTGCPTGQTYDSGSGSCVDIAPPPPPATATAAPTEQPSPTAASTTEPSPTPTTTPTPEPTATSTPEPTATPTEEPTSTPTEEPTATPTEDTGTCTQAGGSCGDGLPPCCLPFVCFSGVCSM